MNHRSWLELLMPTRLQRGYGLHVAGWIGICLDASIDAVTEALLARWVQYCHDDALPYAGADAALPRLLGETLVQWRQRIARRWETWRSAGTAAGLEAQLQLISDSATVRRWDQWEVAPSFGDSTANYYWLVSDAPSAWSLVSHVTDEFVDQWLELNDTFRPAHVLHRCSVWRDGQLWDYPARTWDSGWTWGETARSWTVLDEPRAGLAWTGTPYDYDLEMVVEITTGGLPGAAVYRWSEDGGSTWEETGVVSSTSSTQLGSTGVYVAFSEGYYYESGATFIAVVPSGSLSGYTGSVARGSSSDHAWGGAQYHARPVTVSVEVTASGEQSTSAFRWTNDGGSTWHSDTSDASVTLAGPGVVTMTGTPSADVLIEVTSAGDESTARFRWSSTGGAAWDATEVLASTVARTLGSTGVTIAFGVGSYYAGDTWVRTDAGSTARSAPIFQFDANLYLVGTTYTATYDGGWTQQSYTVPTADDVPVTFSGSPAETGLDIVVEITAGGEVAADDVEYRWSKDSGSTWEDTGVLASLTATALGSTGISVAFPATHYSDGSTYEVTVPDPSFESTSQTASDRLVFMNDDPDGLLTGTPASSPITPSANPYQPAEEGGSGPVTLIAPSGGTPLTAGIFADCVQRLADVIQDGIDNVGSPSCGMLSYHGSDTVSGSGWTALDPGSSLTASQLVGMTNGSTTGRLVNDTGQTVVYHVSVVVVASTEFQLAIRVDGTNAIAGYQSGIYHPTGRATSLVSGLVEVDDGSYIDIAVNEPSGNEFYSVLVAAFARAVT